MATFLFPVCREIENEETCMLLKFSTGGILDQFMYDAILT